MAEQNVTTRHPLDRDRIDIGIFVPSVGGVGHAPRELTKPKDIENGANVLLHAVLGVDAA